MNSVNYNSCQHSTQPLPAPTTSPPVEAIADSGCTGHFLQTSNPCNHKTRTSNGISVMLPNKQSMMSTYTCQLAIPSLPQEALQAHMFPNLAKPLISIGQLCDANCMACFTKRKLIISRNNEVLLSTPRDPDSGLWMIPLNPTAQQQQANSAYHTTSKEDHVVFLHACGGYPVKSTWLKAIKRNNYTTWPGLTSELVVKHMPKSEQTIKGHMHQQRQHLQSTKQQPNTMAQPPSMETESDEEFAPPSDNPNQRTHECYAAIFDVSAEIATDLTGRFPTMSSRGHQYILVLYEYDSNGILVEAIKTDRKKNTLGHTANCTNTWSPGDSHQSST